MFLLMLLLACSDFALFGASDDPKAGPGDPDPCAFVVEADDGPDVLMKNEVFLSLIDPPDMEIEPGPNSVIAIFSITVVHLDCPALTINAGSIMIDGGDEGGTGWPENLMAEGGVALQNGAGSAAGTIVDGELVISHDPAGDEFEWDGDAVIGVAVPGGDSIEFMLVVDTTGAGTGEYPDPMFGRFGWLKIFDGVTTVLTGTNYSGPVVETR